MAAHTYIAHTREYPAGERRKMTGRRGRKSRKKKDKGADEKETRDGGVRWRRREEKVEGGG